MIISSIRSSMILKIAYKLFRPDIIFIDTRFLERQARRRTEQS